MYDRNAHSRSWSWFLSVSPKFGAFVVAALCLAFTEGPPSAWQSEPADEALKVADDHMGPDLGQTSVLDHLKSVGIDNNSGNRAQGRADSGLLCGLCFPLGNLPAHVAFGWASPEANYGPGDHGWHDVAYWGTPPCDFSHGLCASVPRDRTTFVQADTKGLIEAIAQAAAEQDVLLLASLLELPNVLVNADRGAIQVTGCDGTSIAGHVPVGHGFLEAAKVFTEGPDSES